MARYSKLIGGLVGYVVGIAFFLLAYWGIADCSAGSPDTGVGCTIFGFSQEQVMGVLTAIFTAVGIYAAPKNAD